MHVLQESFCVFITPIWNIHFCLPDINALLKLIITKYQFEVIVGSREKKKTSSVIGTFWSRTFNNTLSSLTKLILLYLPGTSLQTKEGRIIWDLSPSRKRHTWVYNCSSNCDICDTAWLLCYSMVTSTLLVCDFTYSIWCSVRVLHNL